MADQVKDEKYIVFKRSDWEAFERETEFNYHPQSTTGVPEAVEDAVVIRTRDIYAGPALHAYAHAAMTTLEFMTKHSLIREEIDQVVNYFLDRAEEADKIRASHLSHTPKAS